MADETEGGTPAAGGQLSGEATRQAAIKRMVQVQEMVQKRKKMMGGPPGGAQGGPPRPS